MSLVKRLAAHAAGWFIVWLWPAYQLVQWISTVDFLQRLLSPDGVELFSRWGWAILIPVGLAILWRAETSSRTAAAAQRDFKAACVDWVRASVELDQRVAPDEGAALLAKRCHRRALRAIDVLIGALPESERTAMDKAKYDAGLDLVLDHMLDERDRSELAG